jgi:hypothetical protein
VNYASITIRQSAPSDLEAIKRVAALDSGPVPIGRTLVALEDGEVRAVMPVDGGRALADPFHHTAELVELLQVAAVPPKPRRVRVARRFGFGLKRPAIVSGA